VAIVSVGIVTSSIRLSQQANDLLSYHNNTILESQYRLLLSASNCTDLQCLRTLDSASLKIAAQQTYIDAYNSDPGLYAFGDFYYGPSVDGDLIRDLPSNEWKQGHFTKVPLVVDHNGYVSPETSLKPTLKELPTNNPPRKATTTATKV
jgi:hypothetical protein